MRTFIKKETEKNIQNQGNQTILFKKIAEILFKYDPMNINFEFNSDEYEPEAGTILSILSFCSTQEDARKAIHEEFIRWFNGDVGEEITYDVIAKEIWDVWKEYRLTK